MANKPSSLNLPLLITKGMILFPHNQRLIDAGRDFSVNSIKVSREKADSLILITTQIDSDVENPTAEDVYKVGVLARIVSISERDRRIKARVEVIDRVELSNIALDEEDKCFVSNGTLLKPLEVDYQSSEAVVNAINNELEKYPSILSRLPKNIVNLCADRNAALELCYALAGHFEAPTETKQKLLESNDFIYLAETVTEFFLNRFQFFS